MSIVKPVEPHDIMNRSIIRDEIKDNMAAETYVVIRNTESGIPTIEDIVDPQPIKTEHGQGEEKLNYQKGRIKVQSPDGGVKEIQCVAWFGRYPFIVVGKPDADSTFNSSED